MINYNVKKQNDIFYDVLNLPLKTKIDIINYAYAKNYNFWVDKLDCNIGFARQTFDMSFDDIMKKFNDKCHFSVIRRRGWTDLTPKFYGEIGFRTMTSVDYFLWLYVSLENFTKLIKKFNLIEI